MRRLFKVSASSDKHTTGSPSPTFSSEGWGRESMSRKNGDDMDSIALLVRKLIRSDDWSIISTLGGSKYPFQGRGEAPLANFVQPCDFAFSTKIFSSCRRARIPTKSIIGYV